jgi:two-component system OmpR family sensor kinase
MKFKQFFKRLKVRLAIGSTTLLVCIFLVYRLAQNDHSGWATVLLIFSLAVLAVINIWFYRDVTGPLNALTQSARNIADGSYGVQCRKFDDNEIGQLTDEINQMSEKIATADKVRTEFISQVSHELRTPLTAITGWSETLAFDPAITGDSMKGVKIISKEANRLTGMVEELLEFTRIQDGRFNLRIELVDITAELEDALFTYGELLRQAGLEVNYTSPDYEIPLIPGDPERLKQVFLNILDNAAAHGGDGGKVDVSIRSDGKYVIITMRDYGRGIPEAELPHVKEKFYKGSSKDRGNGIGLSVCDEIVTRHGGKLTVANAEGGGCTVAIYLPMAQK